MLRRSRIQSATPLWPRCREDVPRWLEEQYQVPAVFNSKDPEPLLQPDPALPGLADARWARIDYGMNRDAPSLIAEATEATLPEVGTVKYRRALEAQIACTRRELTPAERKEMLARFLMTFRRVNRQKAPPGEELPLCALIAIAWWERLLRKPPTKNTLRTIQRMLQRRS